MEEELNVRKGEGSELLADHLGHVGEAAALFVSSLKGFRRDLELSVRSFPKNLDAEFLAVATGLAVPPMRNAESFADLGKAFSLCDAALDGRIRLKAPKLGPDKEPRDKLLEEARLAHKNLMDVADTAHRMYQAIQTAGFEFDVFNTKNIEAGHPNMNIVFDRDAVYLAAATARALGERCIRLDIDLVEGIEGVEIGARNISI